MKGSASGCAGHSTSGFNHSLLHKKSRVNCSRSFCGVMHPTQSLADRNVAVPTSPPPQQIPYKFATSQGHGRSGSAVLPEPSGNAYCGITFVTVSARLHSSIYFNTTLAFFPQFKRRQNPFSAFSICHPFIFQAGTPHPDDEDRWLVPHCRACARGF